jgi:choline dehydrogenase
VTWGFHTTPQFGLCGVELPYPRGRLLGGCSCINAMAHSRAHRSSYDAWGVPGWGYDDLLPYFKRSETAPADRDPAYRGTSGPMRVGPPAAHSAFAEATLEAARERGFPENPDHNGVEQEGFGWQEMTIADGIRQTAADAYLRPVRWRANLKVIAEAMVTKLVLDNGHCVGVEYRTDGQAVTVEAGKSVVLAAGAIGSPHLLMLSGIGDPAVLGPVGVNTRVKLPDVGRNLQDHPLSGVVFEAGQPLPAGANNHGDLIAALRSTPDLDAPDILLMYLDIPFVRPPLAGPADGYTVAFSYLRPQSRGSVTLASPDPVVAPVVDPALLTDSRDIEGMLTALRIAREAGSAAALKEWRQAEALPGSSYEDVDFLRRSTGTFFHAVGTCAIGSVVDSGLRVFGVRGLRVADASVMPTIISAPTNATVLAIAERAADLLLTAS